MWPGAALIEIRVFFVKKIYYCISFVCLNTVKMRKFLHQSECSIMAKQLVLL
jgi:hypothetical protein